MHIRYTYLKDIVKHYVLVATSNWYMKKLAVAKYYLWFSKAYRHMIKYKLEEKYNIESDKAKIHICIVTSIMSNCILLS